MTVFQVLFAVLLVITNGQKISSFGTDSGIKTTYILLKLIIIYISNIFIIFATYLINKKLSKLPFMIFDWSYLLHVLGCPNCVDDSTGRSGNRWTMPLQRLGDKQYYLGIFFKVRKILKFGFDEINFEV